MSDTHGPDLVVVYRGGILLVLYLLKLERRAWRRAWRLSLYLLYDKKELMDKELCQGTARTTMRVCTRTLEGIYEQAHFEVRKLWLSK